MKIDNIIDTLRKKLDTLFKDVVKSVIVIRIVSKIKLLIDRLRKKVDTLFKDFVKSAIFVRIVSKIKPLIDTFKREIDAIFKNKVESVIVVEIDSKLKLFNVEFKGRVNLSALKIVELNEKNRDEIIISSLRSFIQENNIFSKYAVLKPSLKSLLIKRIQLPDVPDNELRDAIKWQVKEDVSFDLTDWALDFSIINKTVLNDGSKVLDIICALAQEQEIRLQVMLLKQLGLTCLAVGLVPFGYEKLIEKYFESEKEKSVGILHLSEDNCSFNIYRNNRLEFYRELPMTINQFRDSLKGVLVSDKGRVELTAEEVEEILFTIGIPQQDSVYKDKMNSAQILSMIRPMLERLAGELKRSLTYYDSRFQGKEINRIFISGKAIGIKNLESFLSKELSLDIKKVSIGDNILLSPGVDSGSFAESCSSLGLALDYKRGINLLPREFRTEKIEKVQKISLRWTSFIAFLLLFISFLFARAGVGFFQKRLDNAKVHLNVLSEVVQIKTKVDQLNNFVIEVKNSEIPVGGMLKKISSISARELFFEDFSLSSDSKQGAIKGYIKNSNINPDAILAKFISDMKNSIYFRDVNIVSVIKSETRGFSATEFNIEFKLS